MRLWRKGEIMCKEYTLGELLEYEQPTKYIVQSTKYNNSFETPVLTPGKSFILGHTDETESVFNDLPVIIFDDFTTATKYVDFKFKVKSSAMKILKANKDIALTKYLYYLMQTIQCDHDTHKRYWIQIYSKIRVSIPDLNEQQRIVDKIEELFSKLDKGVEELSKIKEQLKLYRQAVLKEAFELCKETKTVDDVCIYVTDGDHMPPPKADIGIPFIMISNIKKNTIDFSNTNFVKEDYYKNIGEKRTPQKGDVLYTVTGSYGIPVLVVSNKKFCFQRHIALLRPNNLIEQKFLYYAMQTPFVYQQATKKATGTAQKTVGLTVLRKIEIPYTSKVEQIMIIKNIDKKLFVCDKIEHIIDDTLQKSEHLRQSILKQAFEGKLV